MLYINLFFDDFCDLGEFRGRGLGKIDVVVKICNFNTRPNCKI